MKCKDVTTVENYFLYQARNFFHPCSKARHSATDSHTLVSEVPYCIEAFAITSLVGKKPELTRSQVWNRTIIG